ncbi:MAG: hypothetical protein NPIRA02_23090 [Nitrospirales bacterium]|nr:MAG: hypothetical protein NPIRA02_23090 [Nitrospirales bacterium]
MASVGVVELVEEIEWLSRLAEIVDIGSSFWNKSPSKEFWTDPWKWFAEQKNYGIENRMKIE